MPTMEDTEVTFNVKVIENSQYTYFGLEACSLTFKYGFLR